MGVGPSTLRIRDYTGPLNLDKLTGTAFRLRLTADKRPILRRLSVQPVILASLGSEIVGNLCRQLEVSKTPAVPFFKGHMNETGCPSLGSRRVADYRAGWEP